MQTAQACTRGTHAYTPNTQNNSTAESKDDEQATKGGSATKGQERQRMQTAMRRTKQLKWYWEGERSIVKKKLAYTCYVPVPPTRTRQSA